MGILERYGEYLRDEWAKDKTMKAISDDINTVMAEISGETKTLEESPSPYRRVVVTPTFRSKIKKFIPRFILKIRDDIKSKDADRNFIR